MSAAASVLALLPLGALLLVAGCRWGTGSPTGVDLRRWHWSPVGSRPWPPGLAVAVFLVTWLRPVQLSERALAG